MMWGKKGKGYSPPKKKVPITSTRIGLSEGFLCSCKKNQSLIDVAVVMSHSVDSVNFHTPFEMGKEEEGALRKCAAQAF